MAETAAPSPPPIMEPWRVVAMAALVGVIVLWVHLIVTPAQAETVGYRIEVRACRTDGCRLLPVSARRWTGRYACQTHAETIERYADALLPVPGLPRGAWTIRARCEAVAGMVGA